MTELTIEIARECVDLRLEACEGKSYPSLFDVRPVEKASKEARDYLANEGSISVAASAILVNSAVLRMAANFFIRVNKPKTPTRMFTNEEDALAWLNQFI